MYNILTRKKFYDIINYIKNLERREIYDRNKTSKF